MRDVNGVKQKCFVKIGHTYMNMEEGEIQTARQTDRQTHTTI